MNTKDHEAVFIFFSSEFILNFHFWITKQLFKENAQKSHSGTFGEYIRFFFFLIVTFSPLAQSILHVGRARSAHRIPELICNRIYKQPMKP